MRLLLLQIQKRLLPVHANNWPAGFQKKKEPANDNRRDTKDDTRIFFIKFTVNDSIMKIKGIDNKI
jgi:hypothetical protein